MQCFARNILPSDRLIFSQAKVNYRYIQYIIALLCYNQLLCEKRKFEEESAPALEPIERRRFFFR